MSARRVCSGSCPCRYHSLRAISAPFKRPLTRTLMPLQPKRSAESTALRMARRKATRFSNCKAIDSLTSWASSSGLCTSCMSMKTSRLVFFAMSCFSFSFRSEGHALFQLQSDRFAHQLGVQLRLVHFLYVDEDLTLGLLRHVLLELLDFRALAPDDDAGTRRADRDPQLVARTIHFDRAHAGALQPLRQCRLQLRSEERRVGKEGRAPLSPS